MDKYKFLPHTADTKFQAFGKDVEEAFSNSALALTDVVVEQKDIQNTKTKTLFLQSEDLKSLLYDFLEKILLLMENEHFVVSAVHALKIDHGKRYILSAELQGDVGIEKYDYKRTVKAVTYNDMVIDQKPDKTTIEVVLDL